MIANKENFKSKMTYPSIGFGWTGRIRKLHQKTNGTLIINK